jgi:transposase-like protein
MMHTYYPDLESIDQQSFQLQNEDCLHCGQAAQLVSHGFIYKKQGVAKALLPVGKRLWCSTRFGRTGCGRTRQLYLDSVVKSLHYAGEVVVAFVASLMRGLGIAQAYQQVTGTNNSRHAYRWLRRLSLCLIDYRHVPGLAHFDCVAHRFVQAITPRRQLLTISFTLLLQRFPTPLCAAYQAALQRSFL